MPLPSTNNAAKGTDNAVNGYENHCTLAVTGVVGNKRPQFSLFGDTINTAARMQSKCLKNRIQISPSTMAYAEAAGFILEPHVIVAKGKGEMSCALICNTVRMKILYVYIYIDTHTHTHTHTRARTHTHTNTHTSPHQPSWAPRCCPRIYIDPRILRLPTHTPPPPPHTPETLLF